MIFVKAYLDNNEIRRFGISLENLYENVVRTVKEIFPALKDRDTFRLHWIDAEGDEITVSSEEEIQDAIRNMRNELLRIYISTQTEQSPETKHPDVQCAGCGGDIYDVRYKCLQCPSYSLCQTCEARNLHPSHCMIKIIRPRQQTPQSPGWQWNQIRQGITTADHYLRSVGNSVVSMLKLLAFLGTYGLAHYGQNAEPEPTNHRLPTTLMSPENGVATEEDNEPGTDDVTNSVGATTANELPAPDQHDRSNHSEGAIANQQLTASQQTGNNGHALCLVNVYSALLEMGFCDEGGRVAQAVASSDGNIQQAISLLLPTL